VARQDDYREAFRLAEQQLMAAHLHRRAKCAGAPIHLEADGAIVLELPFLNKTHRLRVDATGVEVQGEDPETEISLPVKVLLAHYVLQATGEPETGTWITFRDIPDGHFYFDAFQRRARNPFLQTFGPAPELFERCAPLLGGVPAEHGDIARIFRVLPRVPVEIVLWRGDEEFPPEASILFDANVAHLLPAEDIAFLSGQLVYTLMGMARGLAAKA